jgi:peroxiredoxin
MMPLGTIAPHFELPDTVSGKTKTISEFTSGKAIVIMFICNHCPYVVHVQEEIIRLANDYLSKGILFIAISSNDINNYPADSPEKMKEMALAKNYPFPYLFDESQDVARSYNASCTPDFYIFDQDLKCVYRGQLDDSRPGNGIPLSGRDIRKALDDLLNGETVCADQKPSIGCNIKWK